MLGPSVMVPLFCAAIVLGYLLLARGVATTQGNELSRPQSLFTAVNAATLTGFQQARNPDLYTRAGQLLTFVLILAGTFFSFVCGGMAVIRIARLRYSPVQLINSALGSILLIGIGGGLAIKAGEIGSGHSRTFFESVYLAISAFGNSGLTLGRLPGASSITALLVLLPLAVVGGLGLPVLMEMVDRLRGKAALSLHARTVLSWTAGSYLLITLVLCLLRWPGASAGVSDWRSLFVEASGQSINARSAGFAFAYASALPQAITFALVLVMVIGASPAGTAGGLKVTTLAVLTRGVRDCFAGLTASRALAAAMIWTLVYLAMLVASTLGLLMAEPEIKLERSLFMAASALGNVGLSHNSVDVSTAGLYILSATMLLGRVAPVMMLWTVADSLPEVDVAIG
jgi:Trk-type K+ transport system membrane component